jgi:sigma-E factor negative regulatory protein RseC
MKIDQVTTIHMIFTFQVYYQSGYRENAMHEIGFVKSINGAMAQVVISRKKSLCEKCEKPACDMPEDGIETEAFNEARAGVGQKVKVVMKAYTFYKGALLIYVLPVFALIGGAILGKIYFPGYFSKIDSDLLAAIAGFIAMLLSILILKIVSGRMSKKTTFKSVIESIEED